MRIRSTEVPRSGQAACDERRDRQRAARPLALATLFTCVGACQGVEPSAPQTATATAAERHDEHEHGRRCDWEQWGGGPGHTGAACEEVDGLDRITAHLTFDPFLADEAADAEAQQGAADLFTHYQTPLLVGDDVYMETKAGTYTSCDSVPDGDPCGLFAWNTQVWTERAFHWSHGQLVPDWTFASDWKPEPGPLAGGWEPVFHAVVAGAFIYVPGASGSLHKLDRRTGHEVATIKLPGVGDDPSTFVAGGIAADPHGNLYYNALALDPVVPFRSPRNAWLVKVRADDTVAMAEFSTIVTGAPAETDLCVGQFQRNQLPWPPSPDAVPPSFLCGKQRPPLNVTPAIGPDGMVVTVSTAHFNRRYTFVVAVDADLAPRWSTSLRDQLHDGCGVTSPSDVPPGSTDVPNIFSRCRVGANVGVDPATNAPPAGQASDQSSSSPVILPDGGVLYGAFTGYNQFRGHLFKLDAHGAHAATYDFGWDVTPAVFRHDGTYSIVTKDNRYFDRVFNLSQLDSQLRVEWSFTATNQQSCHRDAAGQVACADDPDHVNGFEWCVNAPAVDPEGNVYANSEDGWVYKIGQGGHQLDRTFLLQSLGAAYTPISIDRHGRLFSLNGGDLFVVEGHHGEHDGHDHHDD